MESAVSVLIPTYNSAHLLPDTLESILSQTHPPGEIIVVDDGSTDRTEDALTRFKGRIAYHRVENGGVCRARCGFREQFGRNPPEDFEFALRCVAHGPIGIVPEPVAGVRRHSANFSRDMEANARGQIAIMDYALEHDSVNDATRSILHRELDLRHIELSYGAFRRADFAEVVSRLSTLNSVTLDPKTRLKLLISRMPAPLAKTLQSFLLH